MHLKKKILKIIAMLTLLISNDSFELYEKLEKDNDISIKFEDLPNEFTLQSYDTVVDFIQKTKNLEFECLMYFDYVTGKILKFEIGTSNNVKIDFNKEFDDHHVASIHNHPKSVYSPPSGKNFGILMREFEDYELIVGDSGLWILKAKGINFNLNLDLKYSALMILDSCQEYSIKRYPPSKANDICDVMYGTMLSNYINDKNLKDIQLTKKEYQL